MIEQEFSPLRSRATRKPWPQCPDVVIYRCSHCGKLYQLLDYDKPVEEPVCCETPMKILNPIPLKEVSSDINIDYQIVGGHNQNAVQVFWEENRLEDKPEWILLKTYTGGYIKYMTPKKLPPMVFPLSDEDAYVYCDEKVCLQCVFRCKRGFMIYVYIKSIGLIEVPLDKMNANY